VLSKIDVLLEQLEMKQLIAEFDPELDRGQSFVRRAYGNEQEQMNELNRLGLDEVEAVEYVLMLSRDEEEMRLRNRSGGSPRHIEEEGVFEGEFDDISVSSSSLDRSYVSASSSRSDSSSPPSQRSFSTFNSSSKIQISPRSRPEPTEAGTDAVTVASRSERTPGLDEFPPINSHHKSSTDATSANMSASQLSSANSKSSDSFSWGTPRRSPSSYSAIRPRSSLLTADLMRHSGMQVSKGMDSSVDEGDVCGKLSLS
jgi:hypothetical protein